MTNIIRCMRIPCWIIKATDTHTHTHTHTQNMQYLLLYRSNNCYANAPHCHAVLTLPHLLRSAYSVCVSSISTVRHTKCHTTSDGTFFTTVLQAAHDRWQVISQIFDISIHFFSDPILHFLCSPPYISDYIYLIAFAASRLINNTNISIIL